MEYYIRASEDIDGPLAAYVNAQGGSVIRRIPFSVEPAQFLYSISLPDIPESQPLEQAVIEGMKGIEHVIDVEPAGGIARALGESKLYKPPENP